MSVPKHPPLIGPDFKTVYSTTEMSDAVTIKMLLEGSGIEAEVHDYHSGLISFGMPTSTAPLNVVVAAADVPEASKILRETQKIRSARSLSNRILWLVAAVLVGGLAILELVAGLL